MNTTATHPKRKYLWIAAAVIVAVLAMIALSQPSPIPVLVAEAVRTTATAYVEERGVTSLPSVAKITMPFEGRVMPITAEEGRPVKKGEVVALLDRKDLDNWLAQSEAMSAAMQQAFLASEAAVKSATDHYGYAAWWKDAQKVMFEKQTVAEKDYRQAILSCQAALDNFNQSTRDASGMKALFTLTELFQTYMQRQVRLATLESPIDGLVLKRYYTNPLVLDAGTLLLEIGDLARLEVTADILTTAAGDIRPGNPAEILDLPGGSLAGKVTRIKHLGFTKTSSLGIEEQRIPVDIAFGEGQLTSLSQAGVPLGVAWRVRVRITTATKENAVVVPATALLRQPDGSWKIFTAADRKAKATTVTTGLANPRTVEITSGIEPGTRVILAPPTSLADGDPVTIAP